MENTKKFRKTTHHTWLLIHIRRGRKTEGMEFKIQSPFHVKTNATGPCHKNPIEVSKLSRCYLPDLWPFLVLFVCLLLWLVDLLVIKTVSVVKKTEDKEQANWISAFLVGVPWKVNVWRTRAEVTDNASSIPPSASPIMMEFKPSRDVLLSLNWNSSGGCKSRSKCGVVRVGSSWGPWGRICSTVSANFWGFGGNLWHLLACRSITPVSACILTWRSPCLCFKSFLFPKDT